MSERHTVTISDDEVAEWARNAVDGGPFRSMGHLHEEALKELRRRLGDEPSVGDLGEGYDY